MNFWIKQLLGQIANFKGYKLSENSDKVIEKLIKNNGNCPCRLGKNLCPCIYQDDEMKEKGKCLCSLFVK